jgi:hypothetical protein
MAIKKLVILGLLFMGIFSFIPLMPVKAADTFYISASTMQWRAENDSGNGALISGFIPIIRNTVEITFNAADTGYIEISNSVYTSSVEFYYLGIAQPLVLEIFDSNPNIYGDTVYDLDAVSILNSMNLNDLYQIRIIIAHDFSTMLSVEIPIYVTYWISEFTFQYITFPSFLIFYSGLRQYASVSYYDNVDIVLPSNPTGPAGYNFIGWRTITGELFSVDNVKPEYKDENGYIFLYAVFANVRGETFVPTNPSPNTPNSIFVLMDAIGIYNDAGFMIVYFIIMAIIIVTLLYFKLNSAIVLMISLLVTGIFIYLGWLPIFVIILMAMLFLIGIFTAFKGGLES